MDFTFYMQVPAHAHYNITPTKGRGCYFPFIHFCNLISSRIKFGRCINSGSSVAFKYIEIKIICINYLQCKHKFHVELLSTNSQKYVLLQHTDPC